MKRLGGLFVLGTERHEARRIDNQLRGRSGRQGDPGETQFFVSMEDTLMRVFASETMKKLMGKFGIPEDEPIENRLITRSLETAQTRIEGFNFDARKHILEYDTVLNHQRTIIYGRRRRTLTGGPEAVQEYLTALQIEPKTNDYLLIQRLILQTNDMFFVDHLEVMDYLRSSVNLRAYGQRDPLVEYKKEGLRLFKEMEENVASQIINVLTHLDTAAPADAAPAPIVPLAAPSSPSVGRNDPCPCGKKKPDGAPVKYKHCHGK